MLWFRRPRPNVKQKPIREPRFVVEPLEDRMLPTSAPEQLMIELINRARANPSAEAARYGISLNEGLAAGTISTAPKQPLAPNLQLLLAIRGHLDDMLANNFFAHNSSTGDTFVQRIEDAGYTNWNAAAENLAWVGSSGAISADEQRINQNHQNLFVDAGVPGRGHRLNIMNPNLEEIGSGVDTGPFQGFNAVVVGQDFASSPGNAFLTGVAYSDTVIDNDFYSIGEGIANATITVNNNAGSVFVTTTQPGGGYSVRVPVGTYTVTASGGALGTVTMNGVVVGSTNVKLDFNPGAGNQTGPTTTGIQGIVVGQNAPNTVINLAPVFADPVYADNQLVTTIRQNTFPSLFTSASITGPAPGQLVLDYAPNVVGASIMTVRATNPAGAFVETTFSVTVADLNDPPVLSPIANLTMPHTQDTRTVTLTASDPNGDTITFSAEVVSVDPLAVLAYQLDQQYALSFTGNFYQNYNGQNEKWLQSNVGWVTILPDGRLIRDSNDALLGVLSAAYWANPALLYNAQQPTGGSGNPPATLSIVNNQLTVNPVNTFVGQFQVVVTASDGVETDQETFTVSVTNTAPTLPAIANQTMPHNQNLITIPLGASDADNDPLTFTAQVVTVDPLAILAYQLDQQYALSFTGNFYQNYNGQNEKWLQSNVGWVTILPDGRLIRTSGNALLGTLSAAYWADPSLLYNAQQPSGNPGVSPATVSFNAGSLIVNPNNGFVGNFQVNVTASDGLASTSRSFTVNVVNNAPTLAAIADRTMSRSQDLVTITLTGSDPDGDLLTYTAQVITTDPLAVLAYQLDQQYALAFTGNFYQNYNGQNEKWLQSNVGWVTILPDGRLIRTSGNALLGTLSAAYWADPSLLYNAQPATNVPANQVATVSVAGNVLTVNPVSTFVGQFQVQVTASDGAGSAQRSFNVSVVNTPPTLAPISNRTFPAAQGFIDVPVTASDADGDAVTLAAVATSVDPAAELAFQLDQQYAITFTGNFYQNYNGQNEKWLQSNVGWVTILPDGRVIRTSNSSLLGTLNATYWNNPALLYNAQPVSAPPATLTFNGSSLRVQVPGTFRGTFRVRVTASDGSASTSQSFDITVTAAETADVVDEFGEPLPAEETQEEAALAAVNSDNTSESLAALPFQELAMIASAETIEAAVDDLCSAVTNEADACEFALTAPTANVEIENTGSGYLIAGVLIGAFTAKPVNRRRESVRQTPSVAPLLLPARR